VSLYKQIKPLEDKIKLIKKNLKDKKDSIDPYVPWQDYYDRIKQCEQKIEEILNNYNLNK